MDKILLIDGRVDELKRMALELEGAGKPYGIYTASSRELALKRLANKKMNLIVINPTAPGIDQEDLLVEFDKMFPEIPKIIINASHILENNTLMLFEGVVDYLNEPYVINELSEKINNLLILNQKEFQQKVLTLPSFLKLIAIDKKTCTLTVKTNGSEGHLYFVNGELMESTVDNLNGEQAVKQILEWDDIVINRIFDGCEMTDRTIYSPVDTIIANALKNKSNKSDLLKKKEEKMNKELFEQAQKTMVDELGDGLVAGSFWVTGDGQPLVSFERMEAVNIGAANALFDRVTKMIKDSLIDSQFPVQLNQYYMIDLTGNMIALVVQVDEYQWGLLIDTTQASLGLILNVALPKAIKILKQQ